ncbi:MAG TPA: M1 family aminopeptidase, partial [Anaeromyxobacteraceae bacterium]
MEHLPREVRPLRYALELTILPERDGFLGTATIDVELARPARRLWIHARGLEVVSALARAGGAETAAELAQLTPEGLARVALGRELPAGRAVLRFSYRGRWSERAAGLRRVRSGGVAYALTQLQPGDARRVFPCFDEPTWKVPFQVALTVPSEATAVSNAAVLSEDRGKDGSKRVRFAETVPLTTDRVLLAVGPFDVLGGAPVPAGAARPPLPLRLLAPRGTRDRYAAALEATRALLPVEELWFGVAFPYPKLDVVALPEFLEGGAGSAGAIVHGSERLAFDAGHSPEEKRLDVAKLVARELARQWYGDPAAPADWLEPWQEEAFATFTAWEALERWRPGADFVADAARTIEEAMDRETLATGRQVPSTGPAMGGAWSPRDLAAEVKGAAALRAVERLVGAERLRSGVRAWLEAKARPGVGAEALLPALSRAAGLELGPALRSLVDAPGVPLVDARAVCDAAGPRIDLAVTRYQPLGAASAEG